MLLGQRDFFQSSNLSLRSCRRGMTLIELLIVIVIIGVLVSAVMVASTSLIRKSKTRNTQAVLQIVADAAEQFKRSETEKPTITKHARYKARYGLYPPDELEVFTNAGVPGPPTMPATGNLSMPTGSVIVPSPSPFPPMRFYVDGSADDAMEHRDIAAMIVAIESQGGEAATLLEKISDRNRSAGVINPNTKNPAQFLDRPPGINATPPPNGTWDANDLQIRYILDDWGNPISYLAQRDHPGHGSGTVQPVASHNSMAPGGDWNEASTELIRLNGGQPVIFSYGPDGKDQLKKELMDPNGAASVISDFATEPDTPDNKHHIIDHPANADNVYSNDQLRDKLAKGILQ